MKDYIVLNLIINGIPSIQVLKISYIYYHLSFKPYYKWNTFNTAVIGTDYKNDNGGFKPYYKWNTFNTPNQARLRFVHQAKF